MTRMPLTLAFLALGLTLGLGAATPAVSAGPDISLEEMVRLLQARDAAGAATPDTTPAAPSGPAAPPQVALPSASASVPAASAEAVPQTGHPTPPAVPPPAGSADVQSFDDLARFAAAKARAEPTGGQAAPGGSDTGANGGDDTRDEAGAAFDALFPTGPEGDDPTSLPAAASPKAATPGGAETGGAGTDGAVALDPKSKGPDPQGATSPCAGHT